MSVSSSSGERTSAPSIASARVRRVRASSVPAANNATTTMPSFGSGPVNAANGITAADHPLPCRCMSSAKLALAIGLVAISLSACGNTAKPEAGTQKAATINQKGVDDPRTAHVDCLRSEHISVRVYGRTWLQVGTKPSGTDGQLPADPRGGAGVPDQRLGRER